MEAYRLKRGADGRERVEVRLRGPQLLAHPMYNRSTAFTPEERRALGLEGLLPDVVSTMEQQARRAYGNVTRREGDLERYVALTALQDRNEHLFFRVLVDHLEEFLPIVYTPTAGQACQHYSRIFRRSRGLWITPEHRGRMTEVLTNAPYEDVRLIVVTDNERVLGLGDQGAGGMALPLGKLTLYAAAAGIHPAQTLPVSLDVGTDNRALAEDDLYIGWRQPRLRGAEYEALVEEFVSAVKLRFPRALLQWEDLPARVSLPLLERYRSELPSFNDDIQGTAAVALAGLLSASRANGKTLAEQRILVAGSSPAARGTARLLRATLEGNGLADEALARAVALVGEDGLVVGDHDETMRDVAWPAGLAAAYGLGSGSDIGAVAGALKPTALVGLSGIAGLFTENVVREMSRHADRPTVLLLSGPTSSAEAAPADVLAWTEGRALVATGGPGETIETGGRTVAPGHGSNALVFPGVGLGIIVSEARAVTDAMFVAAAEAVAAQVSADDARQGMLYPPIAELRTVSARVAEAVVRQAEAEELARNLQKNPADAVADAVWEPEYPVVEVS
jgi:malic enzyme